MSKSDTVLAAVGTFSDLSEKSLNPSEINYLNSTENPLSIYAKAEKTWVDGILFFDREEDVKRQEAVQNERARIIQKLLNEKKGGEGGEKPSRPKQHYHCDSEADEGRD